MASAVIMMVVGAALNATAFTGSMYLGKYLDGKHADVEKIRHDKAMEKYQKAMGEYQKKREEYQDWLTEQYTDRRLAEETLNETDEAFVLYRKTRPNFTLNKPDLRNYYKPSNKQKQLEMAYVGGGMLLTGVLVAKWI